MGTRLNMEAEHTVSGFPVPDIITQKWTSWSRFPCTLITCGTLPQGRQHVDAMADKTTASESVPCRLEALSRMYLNIKVEELSSPHTFQGSSRVLLPSQRFQVNQLRGNHLGEPFRKSLLQAKSLFWIPMQSYWKQFSIEYWMHVNFNWTDY